MLEAKNTSASALEKKGLKIFFQAISRKKRFPKNFSGAPQNFNDSKNSAVLERGQADFWGLEAKGKEFKKYSRGLHLWQMTSLQLQFEYFFNTNVIVESTYSVLSLWVYSFLTSWRETTHPNAGNPDAKSSKLLHSTFFLKMINVLLLCSII